MLSDRLVRMIEDHAEELSHALVQNLQSNPRTESYHQLSREAIHCRAYGVYRNLGLWLNSKADEGHCSKLHRVGKETPDRGSPSQRGRLRPHLDQVPSTRLYSVCRFGRFCRGALPGAGASSPIRPVLRQSHLLHRQGLRARGYFRGDEPHRQERALSLPRPPAPWS